MKRSMLQVYVGDAAAAIRLYQEAFAAKLMEMTNSPEGKVVHSELDVFGQILAVADRGAEDGREDVTGNIMQFCLHFEKEDEAQVQTAYEVLRKEGQVRVPLGPCFWCTCAMDVVDRFGVRWCVFVE